MLFNRATIMEDARRNLAPGPPAGLAESISSSAELARSESMMLSNRAQLYQEWQDHLRRVETITGKRFRNPREAAAYRVGSGVEDREEDRVAEEIAKLKPDFPDLELLNREDIRRRIADKRKDIRTRRAGVERRETGATSILGPLIGTASRAPIMSA